VKLGVLRLSEEWGAADPPTARQLAELRDRVRRALEPPVARLHAMGFDFVAMSSGTVSALASLVSLLRSTDHSSKSGDGAESPVLGSADLAALEQRLAGMKVEERAQLPGLDARRADTILAGAVVLRTALDLTGAPEARVCDSALREGIVADYIATHRPGILLIEEFPDLRRRSIMELARRCHFDEAHAQQVARLALSLFHQLRELHELDDGDAELLEYAALLHDIGFHISANRHHRHTQYLIETHDMSGFSPEESQVIALAARYHRKAEPPRALNKAALRRHPHLCALSKRARRRVCHLAALLRLADALDRTHARLVRALRCSVRGKSIEVRLEVDGDPELELWAARRKGDVLESLTGRRLRLAIDQVAETRRGGASAGAGDDGASRSRAAAGRGSPRPGEAVAGGKRPSAGSRLRRALRIVGGG
jgi:exopolyphosphatase/guanosine-5'-triphosphate,3'-diphosphate pyrophosphatase